MILTRMSQIKPHGKKQADGGDCIINKLFHKYDEKCLPFSFKKM